MAARRWPVASWDALWMAACCIRTEYCPLGPCGAHSQAQACCQHARARARMRLVRSRRVLAVLLPGHRAHAMRSSEAILHPHRDQRLTVTLAKRESMFASGLAVDKLQRRAESVDLYSK